MQKIVTIKDLSKLYKINQNQKYTNQEIKDFFLENKKLLTLTWEQLENELANNWTHNKFVELLEMINNCMDIDDCTDVNNCTDVALQHLCEIPLPKNIDEIEIPKEMIQIQETIFEKNSFEEIFNKFILPKSIMDEKVNYWYSSEEKKYIVNLTIPEKDLETKMNYINTKLNFSYDDTLEKTRSTRKKWLEVLFNIIFKIPDIRDDINTKNLLFKSLDEQLKKEKQDQTDKQWGSLHNVIYWFISWKNIYKIPQYHRNRNSYFSFVSFIFDTMKTLEKTLV